MLYNAVRATVQMVAAFIYSMLTFYFLILCYVQNIPGAICVFALLCAPGVVIKYVEYQDKKKHRVLKSVTTRGKHIRPSAMALRESQESV